MESLKAKSKNPRGAALSTIDGLSPWFQRDHRCIFCQREFRSGQALGGHMNVHRRERAKMMLSPSSSLDSLNTTSPNPSMVSSSTSSASSSLPSVPKLLPSVPACKNSVGEKASAVNDAMSRSQCDHAVMKRRAVGVNLNKRALVDAELGEKPTVLSKRGENSTAWMKKEVGKLELSMDFMGGAKDDLDLELRLGRS